MYCRIRFFNIFIYFYNLKVLRVQAKQSNNNNSNKIQMNNWVILLIINYFKTHINNTIIKNKFLKFQQIITNNRLMYNKKAVNWPVKVNQISKTFNLLIMLRKQIVQKYAKLISFQIKCVSSKKCFLNLKIKKKLTFMFLSKLQKLSSI